MMMFGDELVPHFGRAGPALYKGPAHAYHLRAVKSLATLTRNPSSGR